LATLLLWFASPAASETTGALFGRLLDTEGNALPGASATISGPSLQGIRTTTADADGSYRFPLLPPGTYRVEFSLSGFESVVQEGVAVNLAQQTRIDSRLKLKTVAEEVTVKADAIVVDPTQTNTEVVFHEDQLKYQALGVRGRNYIQVLQQAPGVIEPYFTGGPPNVLGADNQQNSYLIDGLNTTDPIDHTIGLNFGVESIQELSFQTAGFNAEYGRATGGIVNVVTKSGGNSFKGSLDFRYSGNALQEQGSKTQDFPPGTTALRFDKNLQEFQELAPEASLGGPVKRDLLWFFADAQRPNTKRTPPDLFGFQPATREFKGWNLFGKLTATPLPNQTVSFRYTNSYADVFNGLEYSGVLPEANDDFYQKAQIYNVAYDAVLSREWLANLQLGRVDFYDNTLPHSGDVRGTPSVDLSTSILSGNGPDWAEHQSRRDQVIASVTRFLTALGSHSLKAGTYLEWTRTSGFDRGTGTPLDPAWCSPAYGQPDGAQCGAFQYTLGGDPFRYLVFTNLPVATFRTRGTTFYLQDQWLPLPNLTINAGLRYDQQLFEHEDGTKAKTLARFQPRLGLAWDLSGDTKTVLRVHAGEFLDDSGIQISKFLSRQAAVTSIFRYDPDANGYGFRSSFGGPTGNQLNPELRPAYSQEVILGVTRRIFANASLDVSAIYRRYPSLFTASCADGTCETTGQELTNRPFAMDVLRSRYEGLILKLEGRPSEALRLLFSYVLSRSEGSVENAGTMSQDFIYYPANFVNRYGYLSDDSRHRLKLDAYLKLPLSFVLSTNVAWESGRPYNVTRAADQGGVEFLEPRGSRRIGPFYEWDAQVQKNFQIGPFTTGLIVSVFNILNTELPLGRDGDVGEGVTPDAPTNDHFGFATGWQRPRRWELGVRFEF
jgi:hypothetical protein